MKTTDKNRETDRFNRIIRDKLANYSLPIEEGSWEELEKRLNVRSRKKIWPWISGISIAASVALAVLFFHTEELPDDHTVQLSHHVEENLSSACLSSVQAKPEQRHNRPKSPVLEEFVSPEPDVTLPEKTAQEIAASLITEENSASKNEAKSPGTQLAEALQGREYIPVSILKRKTKSIALHISSGGRLYAANSPMGTTMLSESTSEPRYSDISKKAPPALSEDMLSSNDFSRITHRPPVSVGLNVRKALNDYWAIESGLTYTYLYSIFENKAPQRNAALSLHYIGIPVNLAISLYPDSRRSWNFYFSAGGMVEKGFLSHYVQKTYSAESSVAVTTISNERIDGLQWSVQAALGISYKLNRDYSIYLEPKVSYYLDNNQPFNVRTEHPFFPGINVGMRRTW